MKKVIILLLASCLTTIIRAQPLPAKLKHTVIIDTDCGIDDMRAISLLLARPEITIQAILTSDGSLTPADGVEKVCSLLHEFKKDNIPVAFGESLKGVNPPWRQFNRSVKWGSQTGQKTELKASDYLPAILKKADEKIILVCLGPLTNIEKAIIKDSGITSKIERIIWYNESLKTLHGFNY